MDLSNAVAQFRGENVKKFQSKGGKWLFILPLFLLALLCVGLSVLVASYFFDRPLFLSLTAPVNRAATAITRTVNRAWTAAADVVEQVLTTPPPQEQQHIQNPADRSSDPAVTRLREVRGEAYLTGGVREVRYFNQTEAPWAEMPFGSDTIGPYGCGPTAMAMAIASLTCIPSDPGQMAQWAYESGYWARRSGSYLSLISGAAQAHGLPVRALPRSAEAVRTALLEGCLVVALMGPGHFTGSGHFILLRGLTLTGQVLVADPASRERSLTPWELSLILDELSASTAHGAPLWALSAP